MRTLVILSVMVFSYSAYADLDDFIEFGEEEIAEMNAEAGFEADGWWAHQDILEDDNAPLIYMKIYSDSDVPNEVGSHTALKEAVRGKSKTYQLLNLQEWIASIQDPNKILHIRLSEFEFIDDILAVIFITDMLDVDRNVRQQNQMMLWSDDESKKCIIASETPEKVAEYYRETITDAVIDLAMFCFVGLSTEYESDTQS